MKTELQPIIKKRGINAIYSYSEYNDFRDTAWRGEVRSMKISELRRKYGAEFGGSLTEEQLWEIAAVDPYARVIVDEPTVYDEKVVLEARQLTFGEKLVGLSFNPSGDKDVQRAKELCAELADLLKNARIRKKEILHEKEQEANIDDITLDYNIYTQALVEILTAQMLVVKSLTFKI